MDSPCIGLKCIQCCKETQMILSDKDVKRIQNLGYKHDFFVNKQDGWLQLKNQNGLCVFHDGNNCLIYENRPEGCRLYPIIFDKDKNSETLDIDCPHRDRFLITDELKKQLYSLVSRVELERNKRMKK